MKVTDDTLEQLREQIHQKSVQRSQEAEQTRQRLQEEARIAKQEY
jgi:hypothetical protein